MTGTSALQFYYTSCRRGLSGYAGFQTRAESIGLQADERRELEGKALYQPPRDAPSEPDAELIAGQFPKSFRVIKLSSGRTALIRSVYAGQDYTGRWGNFFSHALVLDAPLEGRWPIDVYSWSGWIDSLADGDDEHEPKSLPAVATAELVSSGDFSFDELKAFLEEGEGRRDLLQRMLHAVFRGASDSRRIVIRERLELDAVYWIACIQKAFPPACQRHLTCSTYQFDPRGSLAVNATIGETDFLFDEGERKYQFYVFDFVAREHSEVAAEHPEYAAAISGWMALNPQRLQSFHAFASLFDYNEVGADLLHILRLYRLDQGEKVALTSPVLLSMLEFASATARPAAFTRMLEFMGNVADRLDPSAAPEDWAIAIRFLADAAAATGLVEHRRTVRQAWVDTFDRLVVEQRRGEDIVLALRSEVERRFESDGGDLARAFLTETHLDRICARAAGLSAKGLDVVMTEIDESCRQTGRVPTYTAKEVRKLVKAVLDRGPGRFRDLQWAFKPYRTQVDGLYSIATYVLAVLEEQIGSGSSETWKIACRAVGRSLATVIGRERSTVRFELVNHLKADDRFADLLFGEWETSIDQAAGKIEAHADYERNVLSDGSKFAAEMRDNMAATLLKLLPREDQVRQAAKWVESGRCHRLSDEMAASILALASNDVKLVPEDQASEQLAGKISQELAKRRLVLDPDRLELRATAHRAVYEPDGTNGIRDIIRKVDAGSYKEFVRVVLPPLLTRAVTQDGHRRAVVALTHGTYLQAFLETYVEFVTRRPPDRFDHCDAAGIVFWLRLRESDTAWPLVERAKSAAIDAWASRLGCMTKKTRAEGKVWLEKSLKEPELRRALGDMFVRANELRPSWFSRLLG